MKFSIYQESRKGARANNEDRLGHCYSRDALLMVVADGLGGHSRGELAAEFAVRVLINAFRREAQPALADPPRFLGSAMLDAHTALIAHARSRGLPEVPRTTCIACVVQDATAWWAHAGDSRLYHFRNGTVLSRTRDHSQVQKLVEAGKLPERAVHSHPYRNRIYSCLGSEHLPHIELGPATPLLHGDTLLLCSDGLWEPVSPAVLAGKLARGDIMKAVPEILDLAEVRAGRRCDNLTAVALRWTDPGPGLEGGEVTTQTLPTGPGAMPAGTFDNTLPNGAGAERSNGLSDELRDELSDADIERAIEEIRNAIRKHSPDRTP